MNFRQVFNKSPALSGILAFIVIVGFVAICIAELRGPSASARRTQLYYSDDDGQSYFADDINQLPPYDHNGKQAVRAWVFQCGSSKPVVYVLERFTQKAKASLIALNSDPSKNADAIQRLTITGTEIKKPGDANWVASASPKASTVAPTPKCPDGQLIVNVVPDR